MSKFIDSTGMSSILAAIKNKFVAKSDVIQKTWIGTKAEYNKIGVKDSQTLYFVKP